MCGSTAVAAIPLTWMKAYCTAATGDEEANVFTMNNPPSPSESILSTFQGKYYHLNVLEKYYSVVSGIFIFIVNKVA